MTNSMMVTIMRKKVKDYSFDFETTTKEEDCRVWAWVATNTENTKDKEYGTSIETFIDFISKETCKGYFQNLAFDGEFIIQYLLTNGFKLNKYGKRLKPYEFYTLISGNGKFYKIIIQFDKTKCTIIDSYKLIPFRVKDIPSKFNLPIEKLELDYHGEREIGHKLTEHEKSYLFNDADIVAMAMNICRNMGINKITIGSSAFAFYKNQIGEKFNDLFPKITSDIDAFIRKAYKGGYTYVNKKFQGKVIGRGIVLDVNSLYPSVMRDHRNIYPVGAPKYFKGKYVKDKEYPLYVQRILCTFDLKTGYLPTIQIKNKWQGFSPTEYLTTSGDDIVELTLTNIDLELFLEHYDVDEKNLVYVDGYAFHGAVGIFDEYIDYWTKIKIEGEETGNEAIRTIAKLMLNNLYGKFATNPKVRTKWPSLKDGKVVYKDVDEDERESVYVPVACFVTSYARNVTIRAAQKVYDRFVYADTDSLHLIGEEIPKDIEVHKTKLGAWKHELTFIRAKFIRAKCYIEQKDSAYVKKDDKTDIKVTCAGMPVDCHNQVTFDNFRIGAEYVGKLVPKHVVGGIVLNETTFKIRE